MGDEATKYSCQCYSFRKNVQNTRVGGVQVHAFEYAILYKEKSNDAMVQVKFMP